MKFYNLSSMFSWNPASPSKDVVNSVLEYVHMEVTQEQWWLTSLPVLGNRTPNQAWEEDPQLVWAVAEKYIDSALSG